MKRIVILATLAAFSFSAHADEVSKNAGICLMYKIAAKHPDAQEAYYVAPNKPLARKRGLDWERRIKAETPGSAGYTSHIDEAVRACSEIGLRGSWATI